MLPPAPRRICATNPGYPFGNDWSAARPAARKEKGHQMQTIQQSCRGLGLIFRLNSDLVLFAAALLAALSAGTWLVSF
jgi:hypothetical protein